MLLFKNKIKKILSISISLILSAIFILIILLLFQVFGVINDPSLSTNFFSSWELSVLNFTIYQKIGLIIFSAAFVMFILTLGFEYPLLKSEKFSNHLTLFNVIFLSLSLSSILVSLFLMFVQLI